MLSVRWGERALPVAWRVEETDGAIGFAVQRDLLDAVRGWLPAEMRVTLIKAVQNTLRSRGRSLIVPSLSTALCLLLFLSPYQGHGSLRGRRLPPQHLVRSTGAAMSTTGSRATHTAQRPPSQLAAPSPRWATLTSALPSGWISVVSLRGLNLLLLRPAERLA